MLADDCIKRKYHQKKTVHLVLPTATNMRKMNMEYVGPKRFLEEVFHRGSRPSIMRTQSAHIATQTPPAPKRTHTH